jgi:hypothetical protein
MKRLARGATKVVSKGSKKVFGAVGAAWLLASARRRCWHTICYFGLRRLTALVLMKEMDAPEFVKVIPAVLFIIERLSRPIAVIPALFVRIFGLLVQLFGGFFFHPNQAAAASEAARRAPSSTDERVGIFLCAFTLRGRLECSI